MSTRSDILLAIKDADGNISKAARKLGVARRTLQNHMRAHGIPEGKRGRPKKQVKYKRAAKRYAVPAAAAVAGIIGGALLYRSHKS